MSKHFKISVILLGLIILNKIGYSQQVEEIFLYKSGEVFTKESKEVVEYDATGNITHISGDVNPRLFVYKPEQPNGTSVIICPGSGYARMGIENARFIANRLTKMGITAFILAYRLAINMETPDKSIVALKDLEKSVYIVRQKAKEWKLFPDKIGVWGSSAGGHLAALLGAHFEEPNIDANGISLRPDFLVLAWPLISLRQDITHMESREILLGKDPRETEISRFSADEWVTKNTPPTFLVHAANDPVVSFENSIRFFKALQKFDIPAELHIYEKGGHGAFGLNPNVADKDSWFTQLEIWFKNNELIK